MEKAISYLRKPRYCDEAPTDGYELVEKFTYAGNERIMFDVLLKKIDETGVKTVIVNKGSGLVGEIEAHGGTVVEV